MICHNGPTYASVLVRVLKLTFACFKVGTGQARWVYFSSPSPSRPALLGWKLIRSSTQCQDNQQRLLPSAGRTNHASAPIQARIFNASLGVYLLLFPKQIKPRHSLHRKPCLRQYSCIPLTGLPFLAFLLRLVVPIPTKTPVAPQFPADSRGTAVDFPCQLPQRFSTFQALEKVITFFSGRVCVVHKPLICGG